MKRAGKTFSFPWLFIYPLFDKRTVPLRENSRKGNYFIDGKHSGQILTPHLCIDFHEWETRTYTRKLLLNLLQISKNI